MSRFRRIRGSRGRGFRPATDWLFSQLVGVVGEGETDVFDLSLAATADLDNDPETVRRIRGRWNVTLDTAEVQATLVAAGIGVASPEAIAAGPTALPNPILDGDWDGWMWIDFVLVDVPGGVSILTPMLAVDGTIDSKAQRRLEDNHLFFAITMQSTVDVAGQYSAALRWLQSESSKQ